MQGGEERKGRNQKMKETVYTMYETWEQKLMINLQLIIRQWIKVYQFLQLFRRLPLSNYSSPSTNGSITSARSNYTRFTVRCSSNWTNLNENNVHKTGKYKNIETDSMPIGTTISQ